MKSQRSLFTYYVEQLIQHLSAASYPATAMNKEPDLRDKLIKLRNRINELLQRHDMDSG